MMEYVEFATEGNSIDFGDLQNAIGWRNGTSDSIRGVFGGGQSPTSTNTIEYIHIATQGDGFDFGDLTTDQHLAGGACSDAHGGL